MIVETTCEKKGKNIVANPLAKMMSLISGSKTGDIFHADQTGQEFPFCQRDEFAIRRNAKGFRLFIRVESGDSAACHECVFTRNKVLHKNSQIPSFVQANIGKRLSIRHPATTTVFRFHFERNCVFLFRCW